MSNPRFFRSAAEFRRWLEANHDKRSELVLGFYRKDAPKKGITYPEALDEALCHGWIDGVRRKLDDISYTIRFSPRRPRSIWSLVNMQRVEALKREGRMTPAGLAAFARRDPERSGVYSFEQKESSINSPALDPLRAHAKALAFFEAQPPYYRRTAAFWVASAKREDTRQRRVRQLIEYSAAGERLPQISGRKPTR